jgi:hypothetical protein
MNFPSTSKISMVKKRQKCSKLTLGTYSESYVVKSPLRLNDSSKLLKIRRQRCHSLVPYIFIQSGDIKKIKIAKFRPFVAVVSTICISLLFALGSSGFT